MLGFCTAVAILAGCGGGAQSLLGASGAAEQDTNQAGLSMQRYSSPPKALVARSLASTRWPDTEHSGMAPKTKHLDLLYVANGDDAVLVYSYPKGKLLQTLSGFEGLDHLCVDAAGDVYVPTFDLQEIFEYAHGGEYPIATLSDSAGYPYDCSVDPTTGNLAVVNRYADGGPGSIAVYAHASGSPTIYQDSSFQLYYFDAYDNRGDLFIEGFDELGYSEFAELHAGGKTLKNITLDTIPELENGLQWVSGHLAVGSATDSGESSGDTYIYLMNIHRGIGKTIATTELNEPGPTAGFFIQGSRVIVATGGEIGTTQYFHYPAGGAPTRTFGNGAPLGAVVSKGK
jgi:hypothetical protein